MVFKLNVSHKGKTYKAETENESIIGLNIGDNLDGSIVSEDLAGFELKITGTSDKAGFAGLENLEGPGLKKVLLGYGPGMHKKPKGERKRSTRPKGLKLRKTLRGKEISEDTIQINTKVTKEGKKKFDALFAKPEPAAEEKKE